MAMAEDKMITQIGSLPFKDVGEAVDYSLQHDIPFLPELILNGDAILDYIRKPGYMSCLYEFARHSFDSVKVQCVGPVTLLFSLDTIGYDEAIKRIREHLSALTMLDAKQKIVFLDEPLLTLDQKFCDAYSTPAYAEMLEQVFDGFDVLRGIHTCNRVDWDGMDMLKIDIVSFDAHNYGYQRGKRLAWGVEDASDVKDYKKGDLLTLPCGMSPAYYSVDDCYRRLEKLREIKSQVSTERKRSPLC